MGWGQASREPSNEESKFPKAYCSASVNDAARTNWGERDGEEKKMVTILCTALHS